MYSSIVKLAPIVFSQPLKALQYGAICNKYRSYTMISSRATYIANLAVAQSVAHVDGCVIECGVWRGAMIAGISEIMGSDRNYFLFDSFEGLPPAQAIDGEEAIFWQADKSSSTYYNNCKAEMEFATRAMEIAKVKNYKLIKGWFQDSLPDFIPPQKIALLRLDGDWYDSTLVCLEHLSKYMAKDGVIIIDDYYYWDGCAKAVHDFISKNNLNWRVTQAYGLVCVIDLHN